MDDGYMGSGKLLHKAYQKYGLECFSKEVIQFYTSEVELNQGEIYWIAKFNSTDQNIGYNLTYGGDGCIATEETKRKISEGLKGKPLSEEHRRKLSEGHKGEKNGFFGKCHNKETRRKISESLIGKPNGWLGKKHSNETKQKISESLKGKSPANKGVPMSEEQKLKISLARKLYYQKRKLAKLNQQTND